MKKLLIVLFFLPLGVLAQEMNIGTNLLYWATTTPNLKAEWKMSQHYTLSVTAGVNNWDFRDSDGVYPKIYHWLAYPEVKYWFCRAFEHDYIGLHAFYGRYNAGGISFLPIIDDYRYSGYGVGAGFSYGYQWALGKRWGLELSAGLGIVYASYRKYELGDCGTLLAKGNRLTVLPTKLSLSFVYFIK